MRRHPFDVLSAAAGALYVALAVSFLAAGSDVVDQLRWIWPALLLGLGAAGLAGALKRDDAPDAGPSDSR
jgi:hypothetical protein